MGKRYAVLISGSPAENGNDEFWNDTVLMREALLQHGFADNHIFVLYGNGTDYFSAGRTNPRYRPSPAITDFRADTADVTRVFNGMADGNSGLPKLTNEDMLFVWTFDRGDILGSAESMLGLVDGNMRDTEFARLVNRIPHAHRIFCMQRGFSGGFIDKLRSDKTVIMTAYTAVKITRRAAPADNEVVNNVTYHHGRFNYHLISALTGKTVTGKTVNADANGNGFVTMHEVFKYSAAHRSRSQKMQYDDGDFNLGEKLHLSYADIYIRDNLQDTGEEPLIGGGLARSPDINHFRQRLKDPQAFLGSAAARGQDTLFENVEVGQSNYIYFRLQNRGYSSSGADLDIYYSRGSALPTPSSWHHIGTLDVPDIDPGEFKVAGPVVWPAEKIPDIGHYCFVAVLGNSQDSKPDLSKVKTANDFNTLIRENNNVTWKNFDVCDMFAGGYHRFDFQIQGWPRIQYFGDLEIDTSELPPATEVKFRILKRLTEGVTLKGLTESSSSELYVYYTVMPSTLALINNMPLKASDNSTATLAIKFPEEVPDGEYTVSVAQRIEGKEMGRVTMRFIVDNEVFIGNRNTNEVHKPNCRWVKKMNPENKVPFHDIQSALNRGYNGCRYCLPEFDTG